MFHIYRYLFSYLTELMSPANEDEYIDSIIWKIANAVGCDTKFYNLGLKLGFSTSAIENYDKTNRIDGIVQSKGIFWMLVDWKNKTPGPVRERCSELEKALKAAELAGIADDIFNKTSNSLLEGITVIQTLL